MTEILEQFTKVMTTNQTRPDQVRKDWFSDLETVEINREPKQQDPNTIINTPNTKKPKTL